MAEYGSGSPVIAILGEMDALPGISQDTSPVVSERPGVTSAHACGHHLFGAGSAAAAVATAKWLKATGKSGTVRFYGTPAEEGGAGKVYMVRAGLFDDVDTALHWHAGDDNGSWAAPTLANKSAKFRFSGISAHAAGAPERGRSALDAVEAMNHMINMMREHTPEPTRIHHVITNGGGMAPNVVPAKAEVFYYVRHPEAAQVHELFDRMVLAAKGAAMGTETTMEYEVIHGAHSLLPINVLAEAMHKNLQKVGGVEYTAGETKFAEEILKSFKIKRPLSVASEVSELALSDVVGAGSTDVGDVSWTVPTVGLSAATWIPGTGAHSWQAVAAGGMNIGVKGMMVAAKTIAFTAMDLFNDAKLIEKAKAEFDKRRGPNFVYKSMVGNRKPPLNYRDK